MSGSHSWTRVTMGNGTTQARSCCWSKHPQPLPLPDQTISQKPSFLADSLGDLLQEGRWYVTSFAIPDLSIAKERKRGKAKRAISPSPALPTIRRRLRRCPSLRSTRLAVSPIQISFLRLSPGMEQTARCATKKRRVPEYRCQPPRHYLL